MARRIKTAAHNALSLWYQCERSLRAAKIKTTSTQRGGALVEYSLLLLVVMIVLLAPIGDHKNNTSVIGQLITTLKELYSGFSYAISLSFGGLL